ncbi:GatB/YqeY domain-containing protein [Aureimonas sp. AU12]|uniref:GatB/YqeY domain-containing protein n=1 Tax=Aureimonas sp. AU12 TaxID=1638161 RepID=UPI000782A2E2|nr:GatB/YqeY domain-containing protein [Aureimonas sp. AU12]
MRDEIAAALHAAQSGTDKRRTCTLRLVSATLRDRDEAQRAAGRPRLGDSEIAEMLGRMVAQRECASRRLEEAGNGAEALLERAEIAVINEFLPRPVTVSELEQACREAVSETGSKGLRDVGRCMNALKARYHDQISLTQASGLVRGLLR